MSYTRGLLLATVCFATLISCQEEDVSSEILDEAVGTYVVNSLNFDGTPKTSFRIFMDARINEQGEIMFRYNSQLNDPEAIAYVTTNKVPTNDGFVFNIARQTRFGGEIIIESDKLIKFDGSEYAGEFMQSKDSIVFYTQGYVKSAPDQIQRDEFKGVKYP